MKYLKKFEKKYDNLLEYIDHLDTKNVKKLIVSGTDLNITNRLGRTALMMAAIMENVKIIKLLIDTGANLNIQDFNGYTALMYAADFSNVRGIDTVILLIDAGAYWHKINKDEKDFLDLLTDEYQKIIINRYPIEYKEYLIRKNAEKYNL